MMIDLCDPGRGRWRSFRGICHGIGFQRQGCASAVLDLVLVTHALAEAGNKQLPNAGAGMEAHDVTSPIPEIEITDDTDALGIWCPDTEDDARDPVECDAMRAETTIRFEVRAFAQEIKIDFSEPWPELIWINKFGAAVAPSGTQSILNRWSCLERHDEKPAASGHRMRRCQSLVGCRIYELEADCIGQECAHDEAGARRMGSQIAERIGVIAPKDRIGLAIEGGRRKRHGEISVFSPRNGMAIQSGRFPSS